PNSVWILKAWSRMAVAIWFSVFCSIVTLFHAKATKVSQRPPRFFRCDRGVKLLLVQYYFLLFNFTRSLHLIHTNPSSLLQTFYRRKRSFSGIISFFKRNNGFSSFFQRFNQ